MAGFDLSAEVVGVEVQSVEIGAHRVHGVLGLDQAGCRVQEAVLERVALSDGGRDSGKADLTALGHTQLR